MLLLPLSLAHAAAPTLDERALAALAAGDATGAAKLLAGATEPSRLCLRGEAERRAGRPDVAAATLAKVPPEAPCARTAAFTLAELRPGGAAYGRLAEPRVGPARGDALADRLDARVAQLLADPDADRAGVPALVQALFALPLSPAARLRFARAAVARRDALREASGVVADALAAALQGEDTPERRRELALLGEGGLGLLAGLPDDATTDAVRAEVARDPLVAAWWAGRAVAAGGAVPPAARTRLLQRLAAGEIDAPDLLADDPEVAAAILQARARRGDDLGVALEAWVKRWPGARARADLAALLDQGRLDAGLRALATGDLDRADAALRARAGGDPFGADLAAWALGLVRYRRGDRAGAEAAWSELAAASPGSEGGVRAVESLARLRAFDQQDLDGALAWLRERPEGDTERARLLSPDLHLAVSGPFAPAEARVAITTRNIAKVELRLHRIDAEAFLRAGGTADTLPDLDVAAIAPDRRWDAAPPAAPKGLDVTWAAPLPKLEPGLWAVTAAGPDRAATVIAAVSEVRAVARAVGPDLVVAALRGGVPLAGARVLVREEGEVREGRTGKDGVWRSPSPGGAASVLVLDRAGIAWLDLDRVEPGPAGQGELLTSARLDRPRYAPAQPVDFAVVATRDGKPVTGAWTVWLEGQDAAPITLVAGADGLIAGRVPGLPYPGATTLWGLAPGGGEVELAGVRFALPDTDATRLRVDASTGTIRAEDGGGRPVAGLPVTWAWDRGASGLALTDAAGVAKVARWPEGLAGALSATVAGTATTATGRVGEPPTAPTLTSKVDGRKLHVDVRPGTGPALVTVSRLDLDAAPAPEPADPWVTVRTEGLAGPTQWTDDVDRTGVREVFASRTFTEPGALDLDLPAAATVEVRATGLHADAPLVVEALHADAPLDVEAPAEVAVGQALRVRLARGAGLVTIEGERAEAASVLGEGGVLSWTVPAGAPDLLRVEVADAEGRHATRLVGVRRAPSVDVVATPDGATLRVRVTAKDAAGEPLAGILVLSVLDADRVASVGGVSGLDGDALVGATLAQEPVGAGFASWTHGAFATPLAGGLMAEAAREAEAQRAMAARSGALQQNAAFQMFEDGEMPSPIATEGAMGLSGFGSGGGGYGYGQAGHVSTGRMGGAAPRPVGTDARGWIVTKTAADGTFEATLRFGDDVAAAPAAARWTVHADVITRGLIGSDETLVERFGPADVPLAAAVPSPRAALGELDRPVPGVDALSMAQAGRRALAARVGADPATSAALLRRAGMLVAALPSPESEAGAVEALLFCGEARAPLGLSNDVVDAVASSLPSTPSTERLRVRALRARLAAGLPVDALVLDRLERAPLDGPAATEAALALLAAGRPDAARARAPGTFAARLAGDAAAPLGPLPAPEDPQRADWIAAWARAGGPVPAEAAPAEVGLVQVARFPAGPDGRPVLGGAVPCGEPCAARPGDVLRVIAPDAVVLRWRDAASSVALAPFSPPRDDGGLWVRVTGPGRLPLVVARDPETGFGVASATVVLGDGPVGDDVADALLRLHLAAGRARPGDLARWPDLPDAWPSVRAARARARFDLARAGGDAAEIVEAFEVLRERSPDATLGREEVADVARAYDRVGRADRAIGAWKAALGAAWREEVAALQNAEGALGTLATLQAVRERAAAYPLLPDVGATLFHLPERLDELAAAVPRELAARGVGPTDLRLTGAAWDRAFLAWFGDSPHAAEVGFHLSRTLLRLDAREEAATWAARVASLHPESPVLDGLAWLQGLALLGAGDDAGAQRILDRLVEDEWPLEDGTRGPAPSRDDAVAALARLAEARGQLSRAEALWGQVGTPEAARALAFLSTRQLEAPAQLTLRTGEAARIPVTARNVDAVALRAYALDLRTLFLRDGGPPTDVHVDGVRPALTGGARINAGPWGETRDVTVPLVGSGVWWVVVEDGDARAGVLVVRSALALTVDDVGGVRRVAVRRLGRPVSGAEVRAVAGGQVQATTTDRAGVAEVPAGAAVLAWVGEDVAFVAEEPGQRGQGWPQAPAPARDALENVDKRLDSQRAKNREAYEQSYDDVGIEAGKL